MSIIVIIKVIEASKRRSELGQETIGQPALLKEDHVVLQRISGVNLSERVYGEY